MGGVLKSVVGSLRPPFLLLTPVCLSVGIASAIYLHGEVSVGLGLLVFLGGLSAHISANTLNEYLDYTSGLDLLTQRTAFSGGSGSIPGCPRAQPAVLAVAVFSLLVTVFIGLYLVSLKGPLLLAIGLVGVFLIIFYTREINRLPWFCLISPGLAFGPLFVLGAYISVTHSEHIKAGSLLVVFVISLVPFSLVNNLLLLNQIPDMAADSKVGRVTFPIRYGFKAAAQAFLMFNGLACLIIMAGVLVGLLPVQCLAVLLILVSGLFIYRGLLRNQQNTSAILPFLGANVLVALLGNALFALLLSTARPV